MGLELVLASLLCLIIGSGVGFLIRSHFVNKEKKEQQDRADSIVGKAKKEASDIRYSAKKEAKQIIREAREEFDKDIREKKREHQSLERQIAKKELQLEQKIEENKKQFDRLKEKEGYLEEKIQKREIELEKNRKIRDQLEEKLQVVSGMTKEQALDELRGSLIEEAKVDSAKLVHKIEEEAKEDGEKKAKKIISTAIHRFAGEYVSEQTISTVELPSDDIKGRLIGREGRNIRAFEQICGVDLIIDDTPEVVVISSFNVVRKEVACQTIYKLIADGRIHPAKIEEFHDKVRTDFDKQLRSIGEKAQMEIGVHGIHPEILKLIGALKFRTSYTQNQYQHALETAFLAGSMASELGLNVKQARRAGLLHDVGKVLDASAEGSHAVVGADFIKKYGESLDIFHAIRAHHDDEKPESVLAHIVAAADALSGARPGARKSLMESYVSRITDIEEIVNSFDGVAKSYAISAGREVRVLVENDKVTDEMTTILSRDIAKKIEAEMSYPGSIKVTVLRETKAVGIAK